MIQLHEGENTPQNKSILLIDADSTIPNLALMKISAYHKAKGDIVKLIQLKLPYYPNRQKEHYDADYSLFSYDLKYCSVIFPGNAIYIHGTDIIFGGTGYSLDKTLSEDMDKMDPDYSIYPDNKISYGFISRGCIRNCKFCFVPRKEGMIRQVASPDDIIRHKTVKFMDNNFFALPNHKEIMKELIDLKVRCSFNQGLDIRLLDEENSSLLSQMNYSGQITFAFDDWAYLDLIEAKMQLLKWRREWQIRMFVYVHPDMLISETTQRIEWCRMNKVLPYVMRDISCWESENKTFYTYITAYGNQPNMFKKLNFNQFMHKRTKRQDLITDYTERYRSSLSNTKYEQDMCIEEQGDDSKRPRFFDY